MTSVSGVGLLDLLQHRQAVGVGQLIVEQDEVDAAPAKRSSASRRRLGFDDAVALCRQPLGQRPANQLLVVDDQNRGDGHWRRA